MVYAGFWRRGAALFVDCLICLIPNLFFGWVIPVAGPILFTALYKPIFEASFLKATPGKAIMGIVVLSEQGTQLTLKAAVIRFLASYLSGLILCIGYLMNVFTGKRQTLHDMIAESVVVMQESPNVNYFDVWLNELKRLFGSSSANQISNQASSYSTTTGGNTNIDSTTKSIEQLHNLLKAGAITQEEFDKKKTELLGKL